MDKRVQGSAAIIFSTDAVRSRERTAFWTDVVCKQLIQADVSSIDARSDAFNGCLEMVRAGGMDVCRIRASGQKVIRTPSQSRATEHPLCVVAVQVEGRGAVTQRGRTAWLKSGDVAVFRNADPYELHFEGDFEQRVFILPEVVFANRISHPEIIVARTLPAAHPGSHVLTAISEGILHGPRLPESQATHLCLALQDTLQAMLPEALDDASLKEGGIRRYHLARIAAYIQAHLGEPDLGPASIAKALHLTTGHLHRLFDNQARSLAETIWHLRLEACRKDLERGELAAVGIGAVAAYWGFTDQAHFSRRFKAAYGMSPREWRAGVGPSWLAQKSGHGDG